MGRQALSLVSVSGVSCTNKSCRACWVVAMMERIKCPIASERQMHAMREPECGSVAICV